MVFEKEYIMWCWSAEWIARNGCALRWCHRGVGRQTEETVGFPEWTAQFCLWNTIGKNSSEACTIACQNCAVYCFSFRYDVTSKIGQFNWECRGRLTQRYRTEISEIQKFSTWNFLIRFLPVNLQLLRHSPHWTTWVKWTFLRSNNATIFQIFFCPNLHIWLLLLWSFFCVIPRGLNFICRRFRALCLFHPHWWCWEVLNLLTPNVNCSGRTAPLTSKVAFYIFFQQI